MDQYYGLLGLLIISKTTDLQALLCSLAARANGLGVILHKSTARVHVEQLRSLLINTCNMIGGKAEEVYGNIAFPPVMF